MHEEENEEGERDKNDRSESRSWGTIEDWNSIKRRSCFRHDSTKEEYGISGCIVEQASDHLSFSSCHS